MKLRNIFLSIVILASSNAAWAQFNNDDSRVRDKITQAVMKVYDEQLEKKPGDYDTRFARANQLFFNGEYAQALADANEVLDQVPAKEKTLAFDAHMLKARIYDAMGNYEEEIEELREASTLNPKSMACIDMLAKVSLQVNNLDAAERNFQNILRDTPMNYDAMYGLAKIEVKRNNYEKAASYVDRAVNLFPTEPQVYINRSDILKRMQQYEPAAMDLISALSVSNETGAALQSLINMSDTNYDAVMNALANSIDKAPRVGMFYYVRSSIALRHVHYGQALKDLKSLISNKLYEFHSIYGDAALCQMELMQYDDALASIDQAIEMAGDNVDYYVLKARIELNRGQGNNYGTALAWIDKALAIDPNCTDALFAKARMLISQRKDADALKCVNTIIDNDAACSEALLLRGWINKYRLKNAVAAINDFEAMLRLGNDFKSLRGFALHELGNDLEARDWAKKIVQDGILIGGQAYILASALYSDIGDVEMGDKGASIECLRSALANGYGSLYEVKANEAPYVNLKLVRRYPEFKTILEQNEECFKEHR